MRKTGVFICSTVVAFVFVAGFGNVDLVKTYAATKGETKEIYIGGMPAGFSLSAGGVQIIGFTEINTEDGTCSPGAEAGFKCGDLMISAAGIPLKTMGDLNEILSKNKGKELEIVFKRASTEKKLKIKPVKESSSGRYKIGVIIRDSVTGIGTVTYIDSVSHTFGSLGHAVVGENRQELDISNGMVYTCSIMGVNKGIRGKAGELRGMFLNEFPIGKAEKVCAYGIYGTVDENYPFDQLKKAYCTDVKEAKIGKAYIYSTIDGVYPKKYAVEIVKIDKNNKENKNFVVKITDKDLLEETGGIVQGMSGSPILQGDFLIGAITHVFINDPTRGFGIDINTMLKQGENL